MGHLYPAPVQRAGRTQFGMVDARVIRDPSLPTNVKLVYTYLATFCGSDREAFPSRARIAREVGLSVRTVDTANRTAKEAGLFVIARRGVPADAPPGAEHHAPNIYLLRDFDGGYEVGSGPPAQPLPRDPEQSPQEGGATTAHYQDHAPGPSTVQTSTPPGEDDCASSGRKQVSAPKLFEPDGYRNPDPGQASRAVIRAYVEALAAVGVTPTEVMKKEVGRWVKENLADGVTHDRMWQAFCSAVDRAWDGDEKVAWLVPRPESARGWAA